MSRDVTRRQLDTLVALDRLTRESGIPPTLDELGEVLGVSRTTTFDHVEGLAAAGLVTAGAGRSVQRVRALTRKGRRFLGQRCHTLGILREAWEWATEDDRKAFLKHVRKK